MYDLSIVIPAFNEEKKISIDIEEVYKYFKEKSLNGELVVVDDGSSDKTLEVARSFKEKYPSLNVISYGENKGKGYALRTGMVSAQGKYILFVDSGMCVPFSCIEDGIDLLQAGADIAIGSRRTLDNRTTILKPQPLYRRLGSKAFYYLINLFGLIPKGILDTQCGFKLFKKEAAHEIYNECFIDGFMIDLEMFKRAVKKKYKIKAFPVKWSNDSDTRFNPVMGSVSNAIQILRIMFFI